MLRPIILAAAPLLIGAGDAPMKPSVSPAGREACQNNSPERVVENRPTRPQTLGSLPPADHILTVLRSFGGCITPVKVRENIGAQPLPQPDPSRR